MSSLFTKNQQNQPISHPQELEMKYKNARNNLFILCVFSFINLLMLIGRTFTYFLFSATIPYILVDLATCLCGMYPKDYYGEDYATAEFLPKEVLVVAIIIAVIIISLYVVCAILSSKQRVGWLITALVMFSIDTLVMFGYYGFAVDMIVDIVFHIWIIVILSMGISAHYRLKKLPAEEIQAEANNGELVGNDQEQTDETTTDSKIIRMADFGIKSKVLAEANEFGYRIIYRRAGKANELIINGRVYDEYVALIESSHVLTANVGGHSFTAGYNGLQSYITVDGEYVAKKTRLI